MLEHLKPVAGLVVRDPVTRQALPEEGALVDTADLYWVRRLNDGDVERVVTPAPAPTPASDKRDSAKS